MLSPKLLSLTLVASLSALASGPAPSYTTKPEFQKARAEAMQLAASRQNQTFAAKSWRKANALAGGHCMECYIGMFKAAFNTAEYKDAVKYAVEMQTAAETAADKSTAESFQGHALLKQAGTDKPKPALLESAHTAFTQAQSNDPGNYVTYFLDGQTLAFLGKKSEAATAFETYLKYAPKGDKLAARAQHFAANPELARLKMAPPVVVTTADGRSFNLDNLGGRVVLIDFWATWCGPCNRELPHLQRLAKLFEGQPFEIISVSSDADEAKWKSFIATHDMTWNQYRDMDRSVGKAFAVNAIPHYFIIDSDGVLTSEDIGTDNNIAGKLKKLVKRAIDSVQSRRVSLRSRNRPRFRNLDSEVLAHSGAGCAFADLRVASA